MCKKQISAKETVIYLVLVVVGGGSFLASHPGFATSAFAAAALLLIPLPFILWGIVLMFKR